MPLYSSCAPPIPPSATSSFASRIIANTFSPNILAQVYIQSGENGRLILHLINLNYDLGTDNVEEQTDLPIQVTLPDGFEADSVQVLTPDGEGAQDVDFSIEDGALEFTLPGLQIWNVIVIN